ncbi:MAG: hypothetical protein LBE18_11000 [Planctomycetaceae bacterium]|jgi:transposase|nr:hypothetical protein [Planctomycetaceae bacterium]
MMSKKCINYSSSFKAKAAFAAVRQEKTISQLSFQFHVYPNLICKMKVLLLDNLDNMEILFRDGRKKKPKDDVDVNDLYFKIGRLEMENDFFKKILPKFMGRFWLSLKYEDTYLKRYDNITEL